MNAKRLNVLRRYSFCVPPKLDLRVHPKLGEREVTFCHVTEWIEKKLQDEFQVKKKQTHILPNNTNDFSYNFPFDPLQKVFVLPNMDDIYLPLMHSGVDNPQPPETQRFHNSSTESIERIQPDICGAESD